MTGLAFVYEEVNCQSAGAQEKAVRITGYEGDVRDLVVPGQIGGLPVREIGSFAFSSRKDIVRAVLPQELRTLRAFAFSNCVNLRTLTLYNSAEDYYDGVIRSCPSLEEITIRMTLPDSFVIMREMLRDVDVALHFHLYPQGDAPQIRLTFPEYVNEALEDTMARAIHFSIEGAGLAYRECVSRRSIDFAGYDRLLPRLTEYDFSDAADICLDRLMYPVSLDAKAAEQYKQYLKGHDSQVLEKVAAEEDTARLAFVLDHGLSGMEAVGEALRSASERNLSQVCALLMEYVRQQMAQETGAAAKTAGTGFSLEDW